MAPPVLDGMSRGWDSGYGDDEEEYDISEEDDGATDAPQIDSMDEYSTTNNLLRELHTLNQSRLLLAPSTSKYLPTPTPKSFPYFQPKEGNPHSLPKAPPTLEITRNQHPAFSHDQGHESGDERAHVSKRYEGTNKYVSSLRGFFISSDSVLGC